jgi:hypothetical protein
MDRIPAFIVALIVNSAAPVAAQSINVDVGANTTFGTPSSSYGAAASSPGVWNAFNAASIGSTSLLDLSGATTGVTLSIAGGQGNFQFDNPGTTGDDQALMDDTGDLNLSGGGLDTATYTFLGLANGRYRVYIYAWAPDSPAFTTDALASGGEPCVETCGGAGWTGVHVEGATYVVQDVAVSNGILTVDVATNLGWGSCNGIQLVKAPTAGILTETLGVIQKRCTLPNVGSIRAIDVECAFGYYWILWVDSSNGDSSLVAYHKVTCAQVLNFTNALVAQSSGMTSRSINGVKEFLVVNPSGEAVYRFDAATGTLTCVHQSTSYYKNGFAVHSSSPVNFWSSRTSGVLDKLTIDASYNASNTRLANNLPFAASDLAYDHVSDVLWVFAPTANCATSQGLVQFHAVDSATGALLGVSFTGDLQLPGPNVALGCGIDEFNGSLAIVALHDTGGQAEMVVYDLGVPAPMNVTTYCTSGTSTNGCNASISASGPLSAALSGGCTLTAANVEGQKVGLIFYGVTGPIGSPWGAGSSSFLCVKSPTQRTPAMSSGGTASSCDGALSLDLHAFLTANPSALGAPFNVGDKVYAQGWYRDPPAPKTTNLSNGLELTVVP